MKLHKYIFINGLESNSASPTDIWICRYKNRQYIMKVFIQKSSDKEIQKKNIAFHSKLLKHEMNLYKQVKGARNILGLYDFISNISFEQLLTFLISGECTLPKRVLSYNLCTNLNYMLTNKENRPSITNKIFKTSSGHMINFQQLNEKDIKDIFYDNFPCALNNKNISFDSHFKYSIIITRYHQAPTLATYVDRFLSSKQTTAERKDFIKKISLYTVILMITCLEDLKYKKINQNDLHFGNILLPSNDLYYLNTYITMYKKNILCIHSPIRPIIFDFDRGTEEGKYKLPTKEWNINGQCEEYHPLRDVLKLLCSYISILSILCSKVKSNKKEYNEYNSLKYRLLDSMFYPVPESKQFIDIILESHKYACFFDTPQGISLLCEKTLLNDTIKNEFNDAFVLLLNQCKDYIKPLSMENIEDITYNIANEIYARVPNDNEEIDTYIKDNVHTNNKIYKKISDYIYINIDKK